MYYKQYDDTQLHVVYTRLNDDTACSLHTFGLDLVLFGIH